MQLYEFCDLWIHEKPTSATKYSYFCKQGIYLKRIEGRNNKFDCYLINFHY